MDQLASLGIDPWSMLLYLANTGFLLAVLTYFFYKPVMRMIDERREQIASSIEEAERLRKEFEEKMVESDMERERVENELRDELEKLRKFTEEKRAELLTEMEAARAEKMRKAQEDIDAMKEKLMDDVKGDVLELAKRMVLHIVENKVPEKVVQESVDSAWKQFKKS